MSWNRAATLLAAHRRMRIATRMPGYVPGDPPTDNAPATRAERSCGPGVIFRCRRILPWPHGSRTVRANTRAYRGDRGLHWSVPRRRGVAAQRSVARARRRVGDAPADGFARDTLLAGAYLQHLARRARRRPRRQRAPGAAAAVGSCPADDPRVDGDVIYQLTGLGQVVRHSRQRRARDRAAPAALRARARRQVPIRRQLRAGEQLRDRASARRGRPGRSDPHAGRDPRARPTWTSIRTRSSGSTAACANRSAATRPTPTPTSSSITATIPRRHV